MKQLNEYCEQLSSIDEYVMQASNAHPIKLDEYLNNKVKNTASVDYNLFDNTDVTNADIETAKYIIKKVIHLEEYWDEDGIGKEFIAKWCAFAKVNKQTKLFTVLDDDSADSFIACGFVDEDDPEFDRMTSLESIDYSNEELEKNKLDETSINKEPMVLACTPNMLMFNHDGHNYLYIWIKKNMKF